VVGDAKILPNEMWRQWHLALEIVDVQEFGVTKKIEGKVVEVSDSGNLVTDIAVEQFADADRGDSFKVKFDGHETVGLYETEHGQPAATMVASVNKAGFIEIEIVGVSLSDMLGIGIGVAVGVAFEG